MPTNRLVPIIVLLLLLLTGLTTLAWSLTWPESDSQDSVPETKDEAVDKLGEEIDFSEISALHQHWSDILGVRLNSDGPTLMETYSSNQGSLSISAPLPWTVTPTTDYEGFVVAAPALEEGQIEPTVEVQLFSEPLAAGTTLEEYVSVMPEEEVRERFDIEIDGVPAVRFVVEGMDQTSEYFWVKNNVGYYAVAIDTISEFSLGQMIISTIEMNSNETAK